MDPLPIETADQVWDRIERAARDARREGREGVIATDGDGTLWSGDVGEDMFHAFVERGTMRPVAVEAMRREARAHGLSDAGSGQDVAHRIDAAYVAGTFPEQTVCELMAWCFAGWTRDEVLGFARETIERVGLDARLHREVGDILQRARKAAIDVVLVSASPIAVVQVAGARAGFEEGHIVAARSLWDGDVMLADVDRPIPYATGKVIRLREKLGEHRPLVAAFGDNAFDVDLLRSARVGVAVRPKPKLRARAAEVAGLVELARE
jgi:phosphoserine phosphatase